MEAGAFRSARRSGIGPSMFLANGDGMTPQADGEGNTAVGPMATEKTPVGPMATEKTLRRPPSAAPGPLAASLPGLVIL